MTGSFEEVYGPRSYGMSPMPLLFRPRPYSLGFDSTPRWAAAEHAKNRQAELRRAAYQAARHPNAKARRRAQKAGRKSSR